MYQRILVPIDVANPEPGSRSCPLAAAIEGKSSETEVKLVSVLPGYSLPMVASFFPDGSQDGLISSVRNDLKEIGNKYFSKPPTLCVRNGKRAQEILSEAADWQADLIVFGCRPKDAVGGKAVLGSVGLAVADRASCDVFIARHTR